MALEASVIDSEGAPRIGPAPATYSMAEDAYEAAVDVGMNLWPWQMYALDIMMSVDTDYLWLYREVAIICSRQNGKTELLIPRIAEGLSRGERFIHTAQNRLLPRKVLQRLVRVVPDITVARLANGQEEIRTASGGSYMIVAPQRGARGESADVLIVDELREMEDFDFIAAAEPTLTESVNPQVIYLSNAGTEKSIVLNDLRVRGTTDRDPNLAYLEWSADEAYRVDDHAGWLQANPSIGYGNNSIAKLQKLYDKYQRAGELAVFETEHLCRWVKSMQPRLVTDVAWQQARAPVETPSYPALGISVDSSGRRASAVIAWQQSDGSIALMVAGDVTGDPVDVVAFASQLDSVLKPFNVLSVGFDPWTDQHLAKYFPDIAKSITGAEFANASERFVRSVETGQLRWQFADAIAADLPYAARKPTGEGKAFHAVTAAADRSIASVLAAVRAVWLASEPAGKPGIY